MDPFDLARVAVRYGLLLLCLTVHEFAHALAADKCGDPTPRRAGRLSLSPLAHIDPVGTVILPLALWIMKAPVLFGWARPVLIDPRNFRHPGRDEVLVALAGPGSNVLLALMAALAIRMSLLLFGGPTAMAAIQVFGWLGLISLFLALFNLVPLPPLDGSHLVTRLLPPEAARVYRGLWPLSLLLLFPIVRSRAFAYVFALGQEMFSRVAGLP